ncbi:hypothetical protein PHMEG_0001206 [Phytophthora megakarya]|uniref:Uncharacterized protein n=1 Tax=Phytophthora megakarya TaxID=4795 RepID=A0A225X294_9STRA|nr:hypothetical protein PHMEG_0001206 [Phytophthora megakarya]
MPLFDAIESDVAAFFVSQGTVFDALVKAIMDRMASVESNVTQLRSDVTNNFNLVNHRIDANNVAVAEVSAATAATAAAAATASASAAMASFPMADFASVAPQVVTVVDPGGGRNEELEYYMMTLSRQLNMVLEVLFQPHGNNNVVEDVHTKQAEMNSISDVLMENEGILMQLAQQQHDEKILLEQKLPQTPIQEAKTIPGTVPPEMTMQTSQPLASVQEPKVSSTSSVIADAPPQSSNAVEQPSIVNVPSTSTDAGSNQTATTNSPHLDASSLTKKEEVVRTINSSSLDNQTSTQVPTEHDNDDKDDDSDDDDEDEDRDQMPIDSSSFLLQASQDDGSHHRRKSFFFNCLDQQRQEEARLLEQQRQEEARLREQQRRDEELMRRMHELLLQARSHIQQEHLEEWQQQNAVAQTQQTLISHLQEQLQEQIQAQQQREQEWHREQEERRAADVSAIHHEVDRQLETFKSIMAAAQATHLHECAKATNHIDDLEKHFITPGALKAAGALWLKTAADNCIYGAIPETLSSLLQDLLSFKTQLDDYSVMSPATSSLHETVDRAIQSLQQPPSSSDDMTKGSEQENYMYTLRQLLAKVDNSYRTAAADHEEFPLPGIGFLSEVIHRMELGTANLLDAIDFQRENFHQTLTQHQAGLEKLQTELWRQQEVEKVLRTQLGACPSKEDTMRLVEALRDQITATTANSASRMLDTVDDLRYRMTNLPNAEMLDQLASDLHAKTDRITHEVDVTTGKLSHDLRQKADRVEIDRLQSLFEASNGANAPPAYLTKSPLKCLSCDQHLPFAQAPPASNQYPEQANPGSPTTQRPGSPPRYPSGSPSPIVYHNQQHFQQESYQQYPESTGNDSDLGINMGILEELFAASTAALERRRKKRQRLQIQLSNSQSDVNSEWFTRKPTFLNLDDGRNRIPLRKTPLSDQVIYGPAITPNAFRKKLFGRFDEYVDPTMNIIKEFVNLRSYVM